MGCKNLVVKKFLLTGKPGVGKTTLIEAVIDEFRDVSGGFLSREIRQSGVRRGFEIETLEGAKAILAHVNSTSPVRVGKYGVQLRAFERVALPALTDALHHKHIVIIDEIGPMEMTSETFCQKVMEVLNSDRIVVAAICERPHPFTDAMKKRQDVKLFRVTVEHRDHLRDELITFLQDLLLHKQEV